MGRRGRREVSFHGAGLHLRQPCMELVGLWRQVPPYDLIAPSCPPALQPRLDYGLWTLRCGPCGSYDPDRPTAP